MVSPCSPLPYPTPGKIIIFTLTINNLESSELFDSLESNCLIQVSRHDATELQRKLEGELFDKWEEKYEQMEATDIAISDINEFLDHLVDAYEGTSSYKTLGKGSEIVKPSQNQSISETKLFGANFMQIG